MRKMKDSGIDIVADIPSNWEMCCLRHLCTIETGNQDTQNADPTGEFPFYVRSPIIERSNTYTFDGEGILIAGDGAGAGRIFHYAFGKYAVHQRVYRLANFNKINSRFLFIYLSCLFEKEVEKGSAQSTVPSIRLPMLKSFIICIPSLTEQQKIVDYLDNKCSKIDEITAKIKTTINEYKNLKQSVITEAVTKGIRPDREMKDSGIEWIGEIPKEWECIKIGRIFNLRNEKNYLPLEEVQLLSLYTDIGVFPHGEQEERGNKAVNADGYKIVHKNDIVVNIILAWMGAIGISNYNGVTSPAYDVYIPNLEKVVPHFYHYVFRTKGIADECYKYGRGIMAMRWRTYSTEFKQISVPIPPLPEQQEIADYLDKKCAEIDAVIAKKEQLVTELENYKKSLIYEVVTGKKEV